MTTTEAPFDLRTWMDERGWSVRKLATRLDRGPRTIQEYIEGAREVPTIVRLALDALDAKGERGDKPPAA